MRLFLPAGELPEGLGNEEPDEGEDERVDDRNDAVALAWWKPDEDARGEDKGNDGKDDEHSEIHFLLYTHKLFAPATILPTRVLNEFVHTFLTPPVVASICGSVTPHFENLFEGVHFVSILYVTENE